MKDQGIAYGAAVLIAAILVASVLLLGRQHRDVGSTVLLGEPMPLAVDDQSPQQFIAVDTDGDRALATTLRGVIVYRDVVTEPVIVARLPVVTAVLEGTHLISSDSRPHDAWTDVNFDMDPADESTIDVYEIIGGDELSRIAQVEAPGVTTHLAIHDDRLYREYRVDASSAVTGDVYSDHFLSVYDISNPVAPKIVEEDIEIASRYGVVPMIVSTDAGGYAAFAAATSTAVVSSDSVVVVDIAASGGPTTEVIPVGFDIRTIAAADGDRFVVVGEHDVSVIDQAPGGAFEVASTASFNETLSEVADVSGSTLIALTNGEATNVREARVADTLVAFDLDGRGGPEEAWRDELEPPIEDIQAISVAGNVVVALTVVGPRTFSIIDEQVSQKTDEWAFRKRWGGLKPFDDGAVVANDWGGYEVVQFGSGGEPEVTSIFDLPDDFIPTHGMEIVSGTLYAVTRAAGNVNELIAVSSIVTGGQIRSRTAIADLLGPWEWTSYIWSAHYDDMLFMTMRDRIMVVDASDPEAPALIDVIQLAGSARGLDVGMSSDNVPVLCAAAEFLLECYRLNPSNFLESIGVLDLSMGALDIRVRDGLVYAAGPMGGMSVASVSTTSLLEVSYAQPGYVHGTESIEVIGNVAFVGSIDGVGVQVFDVSNPQSIEFLGYGDWLAFVEFMRADDDGRLYLVSPADVKVLDVSDPEGIRVLGGLIGTG